MDRTLKAKAASILKNTYPNLKPVYITILDGHPVVAASSNKSGPSSMNHYMIDMDREKAYTLAVSGCIDKLSDAVLKECEVY